jgi:hypothetical protein
MVRIRAIGILAVAYISLIPTIYGIEFFKATRSLLGYAIHIIYAFRFINYIQTDLTFNIKRNFSSLNKNLLLNGPVSKVIYFLNSNTKLSV